MLFQQVKKAVKRTPVWKLIRPRAFHVYGIGAPKTGTVSLARIFGNYRSRHEPDPQQFIDVLSSFERGAERAERIALLKNRDRQRRFECEVAWYLSHVVEELLVAFPEAKFIVTVREPRSWLRSIIDQCINAHRKILDDGSLRIRDYSFGAPPERYPCGYPEEFEDHALHTVDGYLAYWNFHYEKVLSAVPPGRRLLIQTKYLSDSIARIAQFVDISSDSLITEASHRHRTSKKHNVTQKFSSAFLEAKIEEHCEGAISQLQKTGINLYK
jgi:hypothetical protein